MTKNPRIQLAVILLIFTVVNVISFFTQGPVNVDGGKGWDGKIYYEIAESISGGRSIEGHAPYIYRIGTPFLAAIADRDNLMRGFYIVNIIANLISTILLFYFFRIYFKNFYIILILMVFFLTHWLCNVRLVYFLPAFSDYWGLTFLLAGLLLIEKMRRDSSPLWIGAFAILCFIGTIFREFILIVPLAFLFKDNPLNRSSFLFIDSRKFFSRIIPRLIPVVASIAGIIFTHSVVTNTRPEYAFIATSVNMLYAKSAFQFILAYFLALGPMLVLFIFFYRDVLKFLFDNQCILVLMICSFFVCYTGGIHTERFVLWFIPVLLVISGIIIQDNVQILKRFSIIAIILITQILSNRVFFKTMNPKWNDKPGYPVLTVIGDGNYYNLTSMAGNKKFLSLLFVEYLFTILVLLIMLYFSRRRYEVKLLQTGKSIEQITNSV